MPRISWPAIMKPISLEIPNAKEGPTNIEASPSIRVEVIKKALLGILRGSLKICMAILVGIKVHKITLNIIPACFLLMPKSSVKYGIIILAL